MKLLLQIGFKAQVWEDLEVANVLLESPAPWMASVHSRAWEITFSFLAALAEGFEDLVEGRTL
jgi:hypothetical protein